MTSILVFLLSGLPHFRYGPLFSVNTPAALCTVSPGSGFALLAGLFAAIAIMFMLDGLLFELVVETVPYLSNAEIVDFAVAMTIVWPI